VAATVRREGPGWEAAFVADAVSTAPREWTKQRVILNMKCDSWTLDRCQRPGHADITDDV